MKKLKVDGMVNGDGLDFYIRTIKEHPILSEGEIVELANRYRNNGDEKAREKLILHNLGLVFPVAKKYYRPEISFWDLIQSGNKGLMLAADKFNPEICPNFISYAGRGIRSEIIKFIISVRDPVKLKSSDKENRRLVHRARKQLLVILQRDPTVEEVIEKIELDYKKRLDYFIVSDFLNGNERESFSIDDANDRFGTGSINPAEKLADTQSIDPKTIMAAKEALKEKIERLIGLVSILNAISEIKPRNVEIFKMYYLYSAQNDLQLTSFESIARQYGLTRSRIEQIDNKIWITIRRSFPNFKMGKYELKRLIADIQTISVMLGEEIDLISIVNSKDVPVLSRYLVRVVRRGRKKGMSPGE